MFMSKLYLSGLYRCMYIALCSLSRSLCAVGRGSWRCDVEGPGGVKLAPEGPATGELGPETSVSGMGAQGACSSEGPVINESPLGGLLGWYQEYWVSGG